MTHQRTVALAASTGFHNAAAYDIHRPSYPKEAVRSFLSHLGVAHRTRAKIIDLAAGKGKFTELLAAREEEYEIMAIEPVAKMREILSGKKLDGVAVRDGLATRMDVADGWADAVIAAQMNSLFIGKFANEEALKEIGRVLKPGGKLGIIWNIEDYNQPPRWGTSTVWEDQMKKLILALPPDGTSRFRDDKWREVFDRQLCAAASYFTTSVEQEIVPFAVWRTKELLWDRIGTLSQVAVLEDKAKDKFKAKFSDILETGCQVWNEKGEVELHGFISYSWTTRL